MEGDGGQGSHFSGLIEHPFPRVYKSKQGDYILFKLAITINQKNISRQTHSHNLHFKLTGLEFNSRKILPDPLPKYTF